MKDIEMEQGSCPERDPCEAKASPSKSRGKNPHPCNVNRHICTLECEANLFHIFDMRILVFISSENC